MRDENRTGRRRTTCELVASRWARISFGYMVPVTHQQRLTELEAELDQAKRQNQLLEAQIAELRSIILASMSGTKPDVTTMTQQIKPADLAATATTIAMPQPRQETTTFSVDDIFGEKLSDGATNVPSRDTATSPFSAFDRLSGTGLSPFLTNLDQSSSTGLTPSTTTTNQTSSSQPNFNQSSDSGRNFVASNRPAASSAAISFPFEPATFDIPAPDPGASWLTDTTVSNMPWEQPPGVWPSANAQSSTQAEPYDVSSLEFLFGWDSANVNPARADPTHFFDTAAIMFP